MDNYYQSLNSFHFSPETKTQENDPPLVRDIIMDDFVQDVHIHWDSKQLYDAFDLIVDPVRMSLFNISMKICFMEDSCHLMPGDSFNMSVTVDFFACYPNFMNYVRIYRTDLRN